MGINTPMVGSMISVKEARKLLGRVDSELSDDELKKIIADYEILARYAIREYLVRKQTVL